MLLFKFSSLGIQALGSFILEYSISTGRLMGEVYIDPNLEFCAGRKPSCGGFFNYVCNEKLALEDYLRTAQKIH